jgi:phosphate transport system protein
MFDKLKLLWTGDAPLTEQYQDFAEMLRMNRDIFGQIVKKMRSGGDINELREVVYRGDIEINKLERSIRKQLVTHLALYPEQDVPSCLVLMSIVKDAERMGDLCKNLFEAVLYCGKPVSELEFAAKMMDFTSYVEETFEKTISAFDREDDGAAAEIMQDEVRWNKSFDGFLEDLADSHVSTREAVATTLLVRNLKRMQAHLSNIASSVVLPVHQIDHRPKHLREKKAKQGE